jgi:hypothetical protein
LRIDKRGDPMADYSMQEGSVAGSGGIEFAQPGQAVEHKFLLKVRTVRGAKPTCADQASRLPSDCGEDACVNADVLFAFHR